MDKVNGIGAWSEEDFANAVLHGVSPEGTHYYPSFPYTAYAEMTDQDIADLWVYFRSIPESSHHQLIMIFQFTSVGGGLSILEIIQQT
jgi:hypothetical protein